MGVRCSRNPVSLQSKHGLAYSLYESGVGCLCTVFVSKSKVLRKTQEKERVSKSEVNSYLFFCSSKISTLEFVGLGRREKCRVNNESV